MTYNEFKIKWGDNQFKTFGVVNLERKWRPNHDGDGEDTGWQFNLTHQCDEWTIGNVADAQDFLKNLSEAIEYATQNP